MPNRVPCKAPGGEKAHPPRLSVICALQCRDPVAAVDCFPLFPLPRLGLVGLSPFFTTVERL